MTMISDAAAPRFEMHGATFTGMASPSRGSRENAVWTVAIAPGTMGKRHRLTREELLVCLEGSAVATVEGEAYTLHPGATLIVPANSWFTLDNPGSHTFKAVAVLPVGGQAMMQDGAPFTPPWAV